MVKTMKQWCVGIVILTVMLQCSDTPEKLYRRLEEKELSSGVRYDSLFKGLYLSMPFEDFREYCMTMHMKGIFREGGRKSGVWVECKLPTEMKYPAALNFYPTFQQQVITEMRAAVYYDNVSFKDHPFSKDSLLHDALRFLEKWYGPGFITIKSPDAYRDDIYVKVNGNRRITVYPDATNQIINIWFVDLRAKKEEENDD